MKTYIERKTESKRKVLSTLRIANGTTRYAPYGKFARLKAIGALLVKAGAK